MPTHDDLPDFDLVERDERLEADVRFPTGTVTFLLTDVEGSTRMWETDRDRAAIAIARHYDLLGAAITLHGGVRPLEQGEGDSIVAVFTSASDAVAAALDMQRSVAEEVWPGDRALRVRMAVHTGEAHQQGQRVPRPGRSDLDANYSGPAIIRCARLRAIAHGGQTIVSDATHDLLVDNPPTDVAWRDLGSHRLKDLGRPEHVWQLCHPDLEADFPPLRSLDVVPNNLPIELNSFVGRDAEIRDIRDALQRQRLVTLTGSGGCGKTRLALHAAAEEIDNHAGGVRWVELAPLSDPALVPLMVATALGHHEDHGRPLLETLPEQLGDLDFVAVLDNCEQVLDAIAEFVTELLQLLPRLKIIATSREPLGITGEISWRVPSLHPESAQVLFVERARQARPTFAPDAEQREAIARICVRLDHLPLAIELAAARVRMMQPIRIAQALDDRFRLLTGGGKTVMPRQQTLEASVGWSHDLLDEQERAVLRRLSVFSGGFTLEAAEAVCADEVVDAYAVLELVTRLVDKSLVDVDDECSRYRLLETIRQYARERLLESGESDAARGRHLAYFFATAEEAAPVFARGDGPAWLARLDLDQDNLDTALEFAATAGEQETMLRMVTALALYFELRGHLTNGARWFARALAPTVPRAEYGHALWGAAHVALYNHDYATMLQRAPEAQAMAEATGDTWAAARSLNTFGYAELWFDPMRAVETLKRSIALGREIDDAWAIADGLKMLSVAWLTQHRIEPALPVLDDLHRAAKAFDNEFFIAWYHTAIGSIAWMRGDIAAARRELALGIKHCRAVGDPSTGSIASSWLADVETLAGDHDAAARRLHALTSKGADGDEFNADEPTVIASATLALAQGNPDSALRLIEPLAAADTMFGIPYWISWASMLQGAAHLALGDDTAAAISLENARRYAGPPIDNPWLTAAAVYQLGRLAQRTGCVRDAERLHHEALALRHEHGFVPGVVDSLEALAAIAAEGESYREAARLLGACSNHRAVRGLPLQPADRQHYDNCVTRLREMLDEAEFAAAWTEGEALTLDDAVAYASRARSERKRPSSGWESLTPMELQVVALAADGLTNPQIAERLFVARGTVKVHLSHIFSKLGVSTRAELASAATRRATDAAV